MKPIVDESKLQDPNCRRRYARKQLADFVKIIDADGRKILASKLKYRYPKLRDQNNDLDRIYQIVRWRKKLNENSSI